MVPRPTRPGGRLDGFRLRGGLCAYCSAYPKSDPDEWLRSGILLVWTWPRPCRLLGRKTSAGSRTGRGRASDASRGSSAAEPAGLCIDRSDQVTAILGHVRNVRVRGCWRTDGTSTARTDGKRLQN